MNDEKDQKVDQNLNSVFLILVWDKWATLSPEMTHHRSGFTLGMFLHFLHNETGQEVNGNYINDFCEKNSDLGQIVHFGSKNGLVFLIE